MQSSLPILAIHLGRLNQGSQFFFLPPSRCALGWAWTFSHAGVFEGISRFQSGDLKVCAGSKSRRGYDDDQSDLNSFR